MPTSPEWSVGLPQRLLAVLREDGAVARAELADRLSISRARCVSQLESLLASDIIREAGPASSRGGRRSTLVELNPALRFAAVDIGASSIDVEIVDAGLQPVAALAEPADIRSGPKPILHRVNDILGKLKAEVGASQLHAIGVGVPGPISFRGGVPVSPPIMPGRDRHPIGNFLAGEHGCPVVVDNDVNIMAVGERHGGVARSVDDFLFLKIGTGIGCGIFLNGQVYRGTDGCAGDIGHMWVDDSGPVCVCGNVGCLESLFGGTALARDASAIARPGRSAFLADRMTTRGSLSARDVADGSAEGDAGCIRLIRDGGRRVGSVLAGLVSFLNPSMIVIGGGLAGLGHLLLAEIRSVVYRRSLPPATGNLPIVMSELGARAGVVGAAVLAGDLAFSSEERQ
jgi:glucokinase-like ROK family protein